MASIDYRVTDNWGSGFIGEIKVKAGASALGGWTIEFDAPFDIGNLWNAIIVSHVGNHYVIKNADWNGNVAAGQEITLGFQATGAATASGFQINGSGGTSPPPPPPVLPTLSVDDASANEGNSGSSDLAFTVKLSAASSTPVTVTYATTNGTATAGSDYAAVSGTITFAAGETSKVVHVAVTGDSAVENNETLTLTLSQASGATIAKASATGTVVNDDVVPPPPPSSSGVGLDYAIASNWGAGFTGTMTVKAGTSALNGWTIEFNSTASITSIWNATIVSHVGDHYVVRNVDWNGNVAAGQSVSFGFQATPGSGGTAVSGFMVNGGAVGGQPPVLPSLSIADASVAEGAAGATDLAFTVTLSQASPSPVTVSYATANGTASAGSDFTAQSGTLTFAAGETSKVVHIAVSGDTAVESNETLTLTLSNANGATLAHATATGTIVNDDVAPPPPPPPPPPVALPTLSVNDVSVTEGNPGTGDGGAGWLSTSGNQIVDAAGHAVQIAGVNWFGFESSTLAPHGLWTRGYKDMMDQMVELGFNSIRLPFSTEMLHTSAAPNGIDFARNPDLAGLSALQIMDKIVDYAGQIGLRIILDHHRSDSGPGTSSNGLWYDAAHSDAQWVADWQMLAGRYAANPTVIGADLHNEPYNGHWGSDGGAAGDPNDWAAAAERAGNAIGQVNANWLIFVEGVGTYQGQSYWWGGNLMGVRDRPIDLAVDNKLVYSAHDYPNSVYAQTWFQDPSFPANLPAKFDQMWGYIYKQNIAPVYLGEFGTNLADPKDAPWLKAITAYLGGDLNNDGTRDIAAGQKGPGWTYWSWNPNSGDTGGILGNDWQSVNQNKLAYLTPIQFHFSNDAGSGDAGPLATFTIGLSAPATGSVSVDYHTEPGEAGSADFVAKSGTITFAAGEQTKTVSIQISPDLVDEPNEHFSLVLTGAHGATIARATGTATIVDDDPTIVLPPPPPPPPPPPAISPATGSDLHGAMTVTDSWSSGFNATVAVHNDGSATSAWQLAIDMPYQITDIWNARIVSHSATGYVIGGDSWNTSLAHGGDTSFGFVAAGAFSAANVILHDASQPVTPPDDPSVPTGLVVHDTASDHTTLAWNAATPGADPVTGYAVFVDGHQVATTTATSYTVTGLDPDTTYRFSVSALDQDGASAQSSALAVHTHALPGQGGDREFTPYIDMAMNQGADLLGIAHASGIENFTLAFVLGSPQGIGWQGVGTIADDTLYNGTTILQQVQAIQAEGGNITISFGGAAGQEAALNAASAASLQALYQSVIDRYGVTSVDFDIEGAAVQDTHSVGLRNQAIAGLQAANPDLKVSFTLPVLPTGLVQSGLDLLASAKAAGVRVDLVNIMTMDYGSSVDNNGQMGVSAIQASEATQQQLQNLGIGAKIGITPMIGVNDISSEVFKLSDAQMLLDYAQNDPDVARLSMWSVARDNGSGAASHTAAPDNSGIQQETYDFAHILHQFDLH